MTTKRTSPTKHLLHGLFITGGITLIFLLYANYTGQQEHKKDIAVMGLLTAVVQVGRYLCFFDPWLDENDED
jgi:hypothetical protein